MKRLLFSVLAAGAIIFSTNQTQAQCYSAVKLDGVNDYLHSPFFNYGFSNFTIEMWINSADYMPNDVYVSINQSSFLMLGGWQADGSFNTWANGVSPVTINSGSGTPPTSTWYHVAYVFDGINQIIYVNGIPVTTVATTGSIDLNNGNNFGLTIGARFDHTQQFTNTTFEDVRIWTIARSQAQLTAFYSTNLTGNEPGLVGYYRFEDGPGSTTVTDLSGDGNHLTLYNTDPATVWVSGLFTQDSQGTDVISSCDPITWIDGNTYSANNNSATHTIAGGAAGGCDSIVTLDLTITSAATSTDAHTACNSYTWIDGNTYTANNNSAVHTIAGGAANGCDSIVTLDLTINPIDLTITSSSPPALTANEAAAQYQWINCDGFTAIAGETGQTYTATTTGSYAAIVTATNGCSDTTTCEAVEFSSLEESNLINGISVSPNPTNGKFSISTVNNSGEIAIRVLDLTGKLIYSSSATLGPNNSAEIDLTDASNGIYIVHVSDSTDSQSIRVVKE